MGKVFSGIPQELALNIKKVNKIDFFIETGTCYGETAAWAASVFEKVFTVELSQKLAEIAKGRLSQYQNVFLLEGNSADQLKNILQQMKGISGIFWLDAHYSGGDTAGTGKKAPVEDELTILMQCKETHCILIDDARFFEAPLSRISGEYPGLSVIISLVDWKRYAVFIVDDVILLLPANEANNELVHKYVWKQDFLRTRRTFRFYWNALKTGNIKGFLVGILLLSGFYSINKKRN